MSQEDQLEKLWLHMEAASIQLDNWLEIPSEQQQALLHDAWLALATQTGEAEFWKLSPKVQFDIDFLAWTGCCMHKELNAVKGGASAMANMWENLNIEPPMALRNKYDIINLKLSEKANEHPAWGAIKLNSLAGALFNNKDDKKGHQSIVDNYLMDVLGHSNQFADTSNTQYGLHCNAAIELIAHREAYIMLLEVICNSKNVPSFTNIELNVYWALQDVPMLTKLVVLCLHAQVIGRPYMCAVCGSNCNVLDLGPLHDQVKAHCHTIVNNPNLLLNSSPKNTPTPDGQPWDCPDTWEQFTVEFEPGETIAEATQGQHDSAWNPATNNISKGLLGQCQQMLRWAPNMTDNQRNAWVMWHCNGTYNWSQQSLTKEDKAFVQCEAQVLDSSGESQRICKSISNGLMEKVVANQAWKVKSAEQKTAYQKRIALIQLNKDASYNNLCKMKVLELDNQINKLHESNKHTLVKSRLKTKQAKVLEIMEALKQQKKEAEATDQPIVRANNYHKWDPTMLKAIAR
ncbi:hypothetical protein RhiXN_10807 [Rhizoctonia solani]|uniref:Uncharacterized protein n=1 Tax=Rhizoctonia solani TaxID=456999 RepID=A0A8H8P5U7_9AGAM|nr:uncharacterized protein RhiXN_10807 [Rhizoctonia solani]QRW25730.1 hypothetical protein RhiXN_10807 [Rhizoctonia solani]